jgi:hypothetical protein
MCFLAAILPTRGGLIALVMALLQGCAAASRYEAVANPPKPASRAALAVGQVETIPDLNGVWQGETLAGCERPLHNSRCHAINNIGFTLLQNGRTVTGYYKCAYGNFECRNMNDTGRIGNGDLSAKLLTLRVMMPDASDCIFCG